MVKYLIIGSTGQLGQAFAQRLGDAAVAVTRPDFDLTRKGAADALLDTHRPEVVLNCAAYNHVDRAEVEPAEAFAVNAWGVKDLAQACARVGAFLVHFSTDYVFGLDEARRSPYTENDLPGPVNVYGTSKLAGEYLIRSTTRGHLVVRTCGLYGRLASGGKKTNFVEAILRQAASGKPVQVVDDQICSPTYVPDLVDAVLECLHRGVSGIIHLVNAGAISWYEFACAIVHFAGVSADIRPIPSSERGSLARRPVYSALASARKEAPVLRSWESALRDYLSARPNI